MFEALLPWALAVVGLVLAATASLRLFQRHLAAPPAFLDLLERLCKKGEFERARKLCRAAAVFPAAVLAGHALGLRLDPLVYPESDASYRSAPVAVPFAQRVREALMPTLVAQRAVVRRQPVYALAGTIMTFVAVGRGSGPHVAMAAGTLLLTLYVIWRALTIERGLLLVFERLSSLVLPGDQMHAPTADTSPAAH
jgi:hypothetical protein